MLEREWQNERKRKKINKPNTTNFYWNSFSAAQTWTRFYILPSTARQTTAVRLFRTSSFSAFSSIGLCARCVPFALFRTVWVLLGKALQCVCHNRTLDELCVCVHTVHILCSAQVRRANSAIAEADIVFAVFATVCCLFSFTVNNPHAQRPKASRREYSQCESHMPSSNTV